MGPKKKKPGRPRKERREDQPKFWKKVLHDHNVGPYRALPKWLLFEWALRDEEGVSLEKGFSLKKSAKTQGATQQSVSAQWELAANESVVLSQEWLRFLEYMNVAAEALSPEDKGAAIKENFLEYARCHHQEAPIEIPAEVGAPEDLRQLLATGVLEVTLESDRRHKIIHFVRHENPSEK